MTGPEHYREAEQILTRLADSDMIRGDEGEAELLAEAQVHATLALAAATAAQLDTLQHPQWWEVTSGRA